MAKAKGVRFGRPTANKNKVSYAIEQTVKEITDITGISKATMYRKIKEQV